jgi:hypothetical protein
MDTIDVVDTKILSAFEEAHLDQEDHCANIGTIAQFQILTPSLLGQSFKALATLSDTVNLERPSLQMVLGKGSVFATRNSLHSYYNAMIEGCHDSKAEFVDFANLGYSLIVQGGHRDNTAAAVSFIIQPDGIFVCVIAESHSPHSGSCKLTKDYFQPATKSQRALLRSVEGGSFRGQGLETFLIGVLSRFAVLKCNARVAMYLKCTHAQVSFYARHGFELVRKEHIPSPNLFAAVPKSKMLAQPPDTFLVCMAQSTPGATEPNLSDAASALRLLKNLPPAPQEVTADSKNPPPSPRANTAHLKVPPPSPPENTDTDTKRPPGDTNPRDNVPKRSSRKLQAQQQAFDRVTVVHSAS